MSKLSFLHTADWHVLDTQYGKKFRGRDTRDAVEQIVEYAIKQKVDFILNSGDILDRNRPSETMLDFVFEVHQELSEADIPMYSITGNHDASAPSFLKFPGRGAKFLGKSGKPAGIICIDNEVIEHGGLRIAGFPAIPWEVVQEEVSKMSTKPDIIVWHGAIKEWMPFGCDLEMETVWKTPFRLAALLGDLHIHEQERNDDGRLITYPGSTEMTKRDHRRDKYFDLYEIDGPDVKKLPDPIAVPLDTRKVLFLRCDSDERVTECVTKVQEAVKEDPDKPPMVFLSYSWAFRDVVKRIVSVVDQSKTVFRYKLMATTFGSANYANDTPMTTVSEDFVVRKPELQDIVDKAIHPTEKLNELARKLSDPQNNPREIIIDFIEDRLEGVSMPNADPESESETVTSPPETEKKDDESPPF